MAVGVLVWYSGDEFSIDILLSLMFLYITQVLPIILRLKWFYLLWDFLY